MEPSLAGIRAKLSRVHEHLRAIEEEIAGWTIGDGYEVRTNFHQSVSNYGRKFRGYLVTFHILDRSSLNRVALLAGDCIHNLRSTLDHLAWQLVVANDGSPNNKTAFPIIDDKMIRDWPRKRRKKTDIRTLRVSGGVSAEALTLIESAQPYQRSDDPTLHPLWLVSELDNIDKHRTLNVVGAIITNAEIKFYNPTTGSTFIHAVEGRTFEDGAVIASLSTPNPIPKMTVDTGYASRVCLSDFGSVETQPIDEVLRELADYIAQLLDCFRVALFPDEAPFYARIL